MQIYCTWNVNGLRDLLCQNKIELDLRSSLFWDFAHPRSIVTDVSR